MQRSLTALIGLRFTRSKSSNKFLSFISLVSMGGLILGVAALIVITSVLNGFETALSTKILGMVPQAALHPSKPLPDWQSIAKQVQASDSNIVATAPFVKARGMISAAGEMHGTVLNGIDPQLQNQVSILGESMVQGDLASLMSGSQHIILGQYAVEQYSLKLGDKVAIVLARPTDSTSGMTPTFQTYTLTGIFHVSREVDKWMSYIAMDDASDILELPHGAMGIRLKVDDVFTAEETAIKALTSVEEMPDISFARSDWTQTHGSLYSAIRMQKTVMFLLLFLIILVAAFNIVSALIMSVTEKKADIAILKTLGATPRVITHIFIIQGCIIGVLGSLTGLALGVGIALNIQSLSAWVDTTFQLGLFDNYFVEALPAQLSISDIGIIIFSTLFVTCLATIYPARKAASVDPISMLDGSKG